MEVTWFLTELYKVQKVQFKLSSRRLTHGSIQVRSNWTKTELELLLKPEREGTTEMCLS